ncbi:MAG: PD-(D/E)XK nuclease family protein [Actinobacteria bacterium]|nr:PD-(D/E)XK nuclease family protein [Actinomycetota bacterium]
MQPAEPPAGLPRGIALSPSRAADFLSCPLLFRYRAIDRFPEKPSSAAARGSLVHSVLEDLFDLPAAQRTLDAATELLQPAWERMVSDQPSLTFAVAAARSKAKSTSTQDLPADADSPPQVSAKELATWIRGAEPLLKTYFTLEDPQRLEPRARELRIEVQLDDGPPLRGIVDRIDVAPGDLTRVVDYKTGRSPGEGFEQKAMFQMRFYALMLWRLHGSIPKRLQLMYLGDAQILHYDPSEDELIAFERTLRALWDAITSVAESGDWQPRPSRMCNWCDHHDRCPTKGGTIPSLTIDLTLTAKPVV